MDDLLLQLVQRVQGRYYGKYRGFVVENRDPEKRGRLRLHVPSVLGAEVSGWALPCVPFGGLAGHGWFAVPEIEAQLWVEFEEGDVHRPIWTGTFWQREQDVPEEARRDQPTNRVLRTPSGHALQMDDNPDGAQIKLTHKEGAELSIDRNGSVALTDKGGATVTLDAENDKLKLEDTNGNSITMTSSGVTVEDANGNKVEMTASGVKVQGQQVVVQGAQVMLGGEGGEPIIKGQSFLTLFATHIHPTAVGPSSPPIPQGEMSSLSTSVMTK